MITRREIQETNQMITEANLDVRTITMGVSLLDCAGETLPRFCDKIYDKITRSAQNLVRVGDEIALEYGVPIVNKRISVTPVAQAAAGLQTDIDGYIEIAKTLDRAAREVGVNFIGGFSALVQKGISPCDEKLILSLPNALSNTDQ